MESLLAFGLVLVVGVVLFRRARAARRREEALALAGELLPEIRAVMESSDPHAATSGAPVPSRSYERHRHALDRVLPPEVSYAVRAFYGSVEAYDQARRAAEEAFRDDSGLSLGDRIRAKDRRDRCLKDVYFTGESALQKLEILS